MVNDLKISVLMPVYNAEKYLRQSIDSVIEQSYKNLELIMVDDGSTDMSGSICDEYAKKDERIKVIHKSNMGPLPARLDAVKIAEGDYIMFLDSDDFFEPQSIEMVVEEINKTKADIVIYLWYIYESGERYSMYCTFEAGIVDKQEVYKNILASDELNSLCRKAIRTDLLKEDPTDYSEYFANSYGEDKLQFLYPVTQADIIDILPIPLFNYRQVESSSVHNVKVDTLENRMQLKIWNKLFEYAEIWGMCTKEDKKAVSTYCLRQMINTYMAVLRGCKTNEELRECINFPWRAHIPNIVYAHRFYNELSLKEKVKLFCIFHRINILKFKKIVI